MSAAMERAHFDASATTTCPPARPMAASYGVMPFLSFGVQIALSETSVFTTSSQPQRARRMQSGTALAIVVCIHVGTGGSEQLDASLAPPAS